MATPHPLPARPQAIVFDLDGTLVDSAPDLAASLDATLERYGRPSVGITAARTMIGDGVHALVERGFLATGGAPARLDEAVAVFRSIYEANIATATRPYPQVTATLEALAVRGIALAVCTNKPRAATNALLAALDLTRFFAAVVGGDEGPRKPDPWPVAEAIRRLRSRSEATVIVGDSRNDLAAAHAAGVACVAVRYGYGDIATLNRGATTVIDRFDALLDVLGFTD